MKSMIISSVRLLGSGHEHKKSDSYSVSKNLKTTIVILAISLFVSSCSKSENPETPAVAEKTVEDVSITAVRVSSPISPKLGYTGYTDRSWFQLVGNDILYTCASNLGAGNPQFMLKYNLTSNSFTTLSPDAVACACGYMNSFVTDNTNAFMIANSAKKYTVATDTWSSINFPAAIYSNIGEAGMSYANGKIFACGGRTATKSFRSYDITANTWSNENDYSEDILTPEMVTVQNKIYLLGGNTTKKNFSCFDITTNTWTAKANLNFAITTRYDTNIVAQAKNRYIFVLQRDQIYVYDTIKDLWKTNPITIPVSGNDALHLFSQNDNTLLVTGVNGSTRDFALYKLTLNLP
jgi:Kelch motif